MWNRNARRDTNVDSGELLEEAECRFDPAIDTALYVGGSNPVPVPVLKEGERETACFLIEPEADSGPTGDGLRTRKPESAGQEPRGCVAA